MNPKHWLRIFIVIPVALLASIATFNYTIDPFQFYGKNSNGFSTNQRYQNLGIINSYLDTDTYDSIVIGTSLSENFYPSFIQEKLNWKGVIKLATSGAVPIEQRIFLNKAIETGRVRNVLWEIALHKFTPSEIQLNDQVHTMPFEIYENNFGLIKSLLNPYILNQSKKIYFRDRTYKDTDLETLGNWQQHFKKNFTIFGADENYTRLSLSNYDSLREFKKTNILPTNNYPEIDNSLLSAIKENPDIEFLLYIPPYSKIYYLNLDEDSLNRHLSTINYLAQSLDKYNNVNLFGFDNEPLTESLTNYRDKVHYSEDINKTIVEKISNAENKITPSNVTNYLLSLSNGINKYKKEMISYARNTIDNNQNHFIRKRDLEAIKTALAAYQQVHGSYPISKGFDALFSTWGKSGEQWISGLSPRFIDELPRDPRNDSDPSHQYMYKSNGVDFKLISHQPEDCSFTKIMARQMIDPARDCWAYGFWTDGAKKW